MALLAAYAHAKKALCRMLGIAPRYNVFLGDGISINGARVRDGAARWPALHAIYNFKRGEGATVVDRGIDTWWMNIRNAQAVRNRLKIAKRELIAAITHHATKKDSVLILSLAAGTAQGVIEAIAQCRRTGIDVRALLLDQDETALKYARKLAESYGVSDYIEVKKANVMHFEQHLAEKPDIVEMMGLIDYFGDKAVQILFQKIWRAMKPGGHFFTCHIHPNGEAYFMRHVINWDHNMRYRSRDELHELLVAGKFLSPQLLTEPHGIHTIAIAQKIV